jgi:hypothetical protein
MWSLKCPLAAAMKLTPLFLFVVAPLAAQSLFTQTANAPFSAGLGPFYSVARDFNGDGILDLAFQDEGTGTLAVLLGDGKGGFTSAPGSPYGDGGHASGLVAADFNGDGNLDLACEVSLAGPQYIGQGSIQIYFGDGKGGFTLAPSNGISSNEILTGGQAGSFATGDFNRDGFPDLVLSNENGPIILLGDGKGGFQRAPSPSGRGTVNGQIAVADFVGNGQSDIVVVNTAGLTVFVCDGKAGFTALPMQAVPSVAQPSGIGLADFNHDRFADLAIADLKNGNTAILTGDGQGGFTVQPSLGYFSAQSPSPFGMADFNGDGNLDLAISDAKNETILLGNGDGTFVAQPMAQFAFSNNDTHIGVVGDFNNDGKAELLLSDGRVWLNTAPAITVQPKNISLSTATAPVTVTVSGATAQLLVRSNQTWLTYANGKVRANPAGLAPSVYHGALEFSATGDFGATVQVTLTVNMTSGAITASSGTPPSAIGTPYAGDFNNDGK